MNNFKKNIYRTSTVFDEIPLPTFREWHFSSPGRASSGLACNDTSYTNAWYTDYQVGNTPAMGSTLYHKNLRIFLQLFL